MDGIAGGTADQEPLGPGRRPEPLPISSSSCTPVITGVGLVCAAGIGIDRAWATLRRQGAPAPASWAGAPPTDGIRFPAYVAPEYDLADLGVSARCRRWLDEPEVRNARDLRHAIAATALALTDAKLPLDCAAFDPPVSVFAANESPGFEELSREVFAVDAPEAPAARFERFASRFFQLNTFLVPHYLARAFGFAGHALFVNSACASGLDALDTAARSIASGRCRIAIVAASDNVLSAAKYLWFRGLGFYADDGALRPFDACQTGTVFGDGAAAIVLEDRAAAHARGAHIYAVYGGGGFAQDGWKLTVPDPTKRSGETALRAALREAGVQPRDVQLVVPHGVGASASDRYEARLLHAVFGGGDRWPAVTALKPCVGHALGASALLESALVLAAMDRGEVPPTFGSGTPFDRDAVPLLREWQPLRADVVAKMTCAFAGYHAAVVFRRDTA